MPMEIQPLALLALLVLLCPVEGLLYPRESSSRELKSLDGLWWFRTDPGGLGLRDHWYKLPLAQVSHTVLH